MTLEIVVGEGSNEGSVVAEDDEVPSIKIFIKMPHGQLNRH